MGGGSSRRLSPLADCCGRLARSDKQMKESVCGMWHVAGGKRRHMQHVCVTTSVSAVSGIRIRSPNDRVRVQLSDATLSLLV